jgi:FKBP-type peptidyl-prolyl cis-trans isomerase
MLFLGNKKEKKVRASNPSWLKWMVAAFIAYAIFTNYTERNKRLGHDHANYADLVLERESSLKQADVKTYVLPNNIKVTGELKGQGQAAYCGMQAVVNITPIIGDKEGDMLTTTRYVGVDDADAPWAGALQGMREGGVRSITLSEQIDNKTLKTTHFKLDLKDALPDEAGKEMVEYQAFERKTGVGTIARCGMEADFAVIIRDAAGKIAYDSSIAQNHLTLTIGANEYFYGLEKGLLGMKPTGIRSLIIPPSHVVMGKAVPEPMRAIVKNDMMMLAEITLVALRNPKLDAKPIELIPAATLPAIEPAAQPQTNNPQKNVQELAPK